MRFSFAFLFFLLGLTLAVPLASPANNKATTKAPATKPVAKPKESSEKKKLVKGINDNIKAGKKEITATEKAQIDVKKNDAKGLKKDEKGIKTALDEATKAREKNQKIAGKKDPTLTKGLGKVENAQKGAKKTVKGLTGNPKTDGPALDKLDKTFKKGKQTNQENLKEAKKNFH
ncbi:hypothetical protein CGCVW01_v006680 [Colletotrichum viniferum]|nr:hypothetical protein CGCVW01_v006680 [Colletotrichum viniferum]